MDYIYKLIYEITDWKIFLHLIISMIDPDKLKKICKEILLKIKLNKRWTTELVNP